MLGMRAQLDQAIILERSGSVRAAIDRYDAVVGQGVTPPIAAEALRRKAEALRLRCDWGAALAAARSSAELAKDAGLVDHFADALNAEAIVHQTRGDLPAAIALFERILTLSASDRVRGHAHQNLGSIAAMQSDFDDAEDHFRAARVHFRRAGDARGAAIALNNAAALANLRDDNEAARELAERAIEGARSLHDYEVLAHAQLNCAEALGRLGDFSEAEELASAALGYFLVEENTYGRVRCYRLLGELSRRQDNLLQARDLLRKGLDLALGIGARTEADHLSDALAGLGGTALVREP